MEDKDLIQQLLDKANSYQEDLLAMEKIDTKKAEETVLKTIRRRVRRERLHNTFYRVAAMLVLPLLLSTVTLLYHYTQIKDRQMTVSSIEAKSFPGAVSKIVLPDNSIVWLNNNSSLVYPSSFGNKYGAQNEAYRMMEDRKVGKVVSLQRVMRSLMVEAPQNETFTLV